MKIEIIRETPQLPTVKAIQLTLTVVEAVQLHGGLYRADFSYRIYRALDNALKTLALDNK